MTLGVENSTVSPYLRVCERINCTNAPFRSRLGNPFEKQSIFPSRARKQAFFTCGAIRGIELLGVESQ